MQIRSCPTAEDAASVAARQFQKNAEHAIRTRGQFTCALSGGETPWMMLEKLSKYTIQWDKCHIFQVDERVVPSGSQSRNLTHLEKILLNNLPATTLSIYAMPVETDDLEIAAEAYSRAMIAVCGQPPVLDLVVLGLGTDGHTASLVPGDPILGVDSSFVGVTREYHGSKRMTLTIPALISARRQLWLITGQKKANIMDKYVQCNPGLPATRVRNENAVIIADEAALSATQTFQGNMISPIAQNKAC